MSNLFINKLRQFLTLPALLLICLVVTYQSTAVAQSTATAPQTAQSNYDDRWSAKSAATVTEFEVNGLKVLVKQREGSLTVAAGLFFRGGSRNLTADNAGIEALMLDTATEASAGFPRERMRAEQARLGTLISYGVNYDYSVLTLASTRQNFDRSWMMFTDIALRPTFATDDFERVKNRLIVSTRDDTDAPDSHLQVLSDKVTYAGHPYLNRPQGTMESLSKLTLDDVRRYYKDAMQTSRLLLVIVGDINPAQVKERVAATLGKLPRGNYVDKQLPSLTFATPSVEVTPRSLPTNYVRGVFGAPGLTSSDFYPMRIASSILFDRVFAEVRIKRNLSYAPEAFLNTQGANLGGLYVSAVDANQAVGVMLYEVGRLQREPITTQDVKDIIAQYLTKYYLGQETNAAQAGELAQYELIGGGWRNSFQFIDRLRSVTPADVQRVARTYMRNMRFVVLGDPKSVDKNIFTMQSVN